MPNSLLRKTYAAAGAIGQYLIVKFTANDAEVALATASTDKLVGISGRVSAAVAGDRLDIGRSGIEEVTYGGTVAAGDPLTADASGRAITAAPAAGVNAYIIGFAEVAGVLGDVGSVLIAPGRIQG